MVHAVLVGFAAHLEHCGIIHAVVIGVHVQEDDIKRTATENTTYMDNVSGALLDPALIAKARALEVEYCESFPVWEERPVSEKPPDISIIGTVWVDVDQGDGDAVVGCVHRICGGRAYSLNETFTVAAPDDVLKFFMSFGLLSPIHGVHAPKRRFKKFQLLNVCRAHVHAFIKREVWIRLPPEVLRG